MFYDCLCGIEKIINRVVREEKTAKIFLSLLNRLYKNAKRSIEKLMLGAKNVKFG